MFVVESVDDLWEFIAYVTLYAPDRFPYEDFLTPEQQMNFDRAFELLRQGVVIAYPEGEFEAKRQQLFALLDESYRLYSSGDSRSAVRALNEFEGRIFKRE